MMSLVYIAFSQNKLRTKLEFVLGSVSSQLYSFTINMFMLLVRKYKAARYLYLTMGLLYLHSNFQTVNGPKKVSSGCDIYEII